MRENEESDHDSVKKFCRWAMCFDNKKADKEIAFFV